MVAESPNVLLIVVDDLRPDLGCYGNSQAKTPHIDRFAKTALMFERAYCQQAVCNPSRTSVMTGLRPDSIGITGNHRHFRDTRTDVVTLPQHFKRNGYRTQSIGKIYHGVFPDGASRTVWDTMGDPESWSVPTTRFGPRYYYTEEGIRQAKQAYQAMYRPDNPGADDWTKKLVFGPMTEAPDVPDSTLYDGKVADAAVAALKQLAAKPDEPFFLAVGFIKPHSPFVAPKQYWELYDEDELTPVCTPHFPSDAPKIAGHASGEIRRYTDQPNRGEIPAANARRMRHGYLACVSYVDTQVGKVLNELDRLELSDETIVVLFSDHGYHLGEHGLWGKTTNFELDTRVPLIVRVPGTKSAGQTSPGLTELLDIFPTLTELTGLPRPTAIEGKSFAPLLDQPDAPWKVAAFSQFPRGGNANTGGAVMGYSMRTNHWRYTEWVDRKTGQAVARELYDHRTRQTETANLAGRSQHTELVRTAFRSIAGECVAQGD